VDRSMRSARRFALKTGAAFPLVHDSDGWAVSRYEPPRMPTTYLVDRRGIIRYVHKGFQVHDEHRIEGLLRQLLAEHL
ncbi:MAG: TlpA family protein disulfide reductase, partial [Myxococcota bacterium]